MIHSLLTMCRHELNRIMLSDNDMSMFIIVTNTSHDLSHKTSYLVLELPSASASVIIQPHFYFIFLTQYTFDFM